MSRPLEGKIAIVTGAPRGIGAAITTNLARKGCNLVLNYTSASSAVLAGDLAASLAASHDVRTMTVQADLGTLDGPADIVKAAKAYFSPPASSRPTGTPPPPFQIDIVVHNAGVALNNPLPAIHVPDFDTSYYVNVRGPLLLTKAAEPYLPRDRSGRIVCISSVSSSLGLMGQTVYGGTKAALEAMARTWARELAERCTVNCVNPGPVATEMYASNTPDFKARMRPFIEHAPLMRTREEIDPPEVVRAAKTDGGRAASVDEIAGVVGMLCGEEAGWCTGQVVCANGGMIFGMQ